MLNRKYVLWLIAVVSGVFFACSNTKKEQKYASMPDELVKIYKEIEKNPRNANLYLDLARYYTDMKILDSALNNALIAIRLDPNNSDMYVVVSDIYLLMQYFDNAEEMLEKAIALDNKNNEAYLKLGEFHCSREDYIKAEEILVKAIQLQTHNPKAYYILGKNYQYKGDTLRAIRSYLVSAEQDSESFDVYLDLGMLYHHRHSRLAIDYYNNALNVQPDNIKVLYNLAMFYQETEDYDKALEKYRMLLQIEPHHRNALHNMGWIYLVNEDKFEEAIAFFTKAIEQDTTYVEAVYNRGYCFEQLKKYDHARQDYMYSLQLVNNFPLAIEALNRLDKGK